MLKFNSLMESKLHMTERVNPVILTPPPLQMD